MKAEIAQLEKQKEELMKSLQIIRIANALGIIGSAQKGHAAKLEKCDVESLEFLASELEGANERAASKVKDAGYGASRLPGIG